MIRQPIVSVLGHVDSGKTTLLDYIRGSLIAEKEPGRITQSIGATEVPIEVIRKVCGSLIKKLALKITIPGLLFIDTPGHAAFISLRKRGSLLSDIAILVVDFNAGIQEQTKEVINILKTYKIPFIIALNKIDSISNWKSNKKSFLENYLYQNPNSKETLQSKIYELMRDFSFYNIDVDRFDEIQDFTKKVAIIPISAKTGEGVPELLMVLTGLAQQYLKDNLEVKNTFGRAAVVEINEIKGFGPSLDIILYDGVIHKNDKIVFQSDNKINITEIKAILKAEPLKDLRSEKKFKTVHEIYPACGAKLVVKNTDGIHAGMTIIAINSLEQIDSALEEFEGFKTEISLSDHGVIIKADSVGGLEALAKIFKENNIPVKKAGVGLINKKDVIEAETENENFRLVFGFNTRLTETAQKLIEHKNVKVFISKVIYELIDKYEKWKEEIEKEKIKNVLSSISRPVKFVLLPDHIFRNSNPAVIGIEVLGGILTSNIQVINHKGEIIGKVLAIQKDNSSVKTAKKGEEVAVSIQGAVIGRNIKGNDILYSNIKSHDYKILKQYEKQLTDDDLSTLAEIVEIKNKSDPRWMFK